MKRAARTARRAGAAVVASGPEIAWSAGARLRAHGPSHCTPHAHLPIPAPSPTVGARCRVARRVWGWWGPCRLRLCVERGVARVKPRFVQWAGSAARPKSVLFVRAHQSSWAPRTRDSVPKRTCDGQAVPSRTRQACATDSQQLRPLNKLCQHVANRRAGSWGQAGLQHT